MKILKKAVSYVLILAFILSLFPVIASAAENEYRISNEYLSFMFNRATGGFAIETAEGNPNKVLDDNIPLLYSDDKERSNGTSFVTVRIGDKDYVFGQDYGFFGLASSFGTIEVKEDGRLIEIPWTISGITVTLLAALDNNTENDTAGNVGLSFKVKNNGSADKNVSIRLLLDTALGNRIDAPYFVIDRDVQPTFTETEYSGENVPQQIRSVDSVTSPSRLAYILMQAEGWSGGEKPGRVILGHWANIANTRYDYTPDPYCDFSNYSNSYREPDSAAAIYWENRTVKSGEAFSGEVLYGVGNFSNTQSETTDIHITAERVELAADKVTYKNNGEIKVTVNIDNTVDNAPVLSNAVVNLIVDDKQFEVASGDKQVQYVELGKEIKTLQYTLRAIEQEELCAGTIYVSLTGIKTLSDGTQADFETAAQRSIILPSAGAVSAVQINKINPSTVYTDGEKAVTLSGKLKSLEAGLANDSQMELKLIHETTGHCVSIKKNNIAFLDESGETLSFTTDEELSVGEYKIVFELNDQRLCDSLKCKSIAAAEKLKVSADKKYQLKSYGMAALVRTTEGSETGAYDFFTFRTENEFLKFYKGESSAVGKLNGKNIKYNFGADEKAIKQHEILITVRADLYELKDEGGNLFWQADYSTGDIIINNMLSYEGEKPLKLYRSGNEYRIEGDGLLKVINSINVWRSKWSVSAAQGYTYTLDTERLSKALGGNTTSMRTVNLSLEGAATMIQSLGGFAVDLKYGEFSSQWYDESDGAVTYGIGFGGSISLPIKAPKKSGQTDLTADQEDIGEELNSLFDESLSADQEDISGDMTSMFDESPKTSSTGDKIKKDTALSEGSLSAEVDNVLFGEKGEVKDGYVKVDDTGFIGIDTTMSLALPKDILGSLVANAPGVYAGVKINTIKNEYELNAGLNIKVIECEGVLAFKQVNVKKKDVIVPDKIEFYIREGLRVPIAPPVLFMAGLGGGINELADTIGGEFDKLPPITILLFTRLEAIGVLTGDFNARVSLEGMSMSGDMKLKTKGLDKLMDLKAGINARWIEPWELSLYGNVSVIDGIIKGGITVTIADNYFYGYIFASIHIPDSVPVVGGKELAGVEAAVSHEFIGANIKIIGIKFGVVYYWGDKVSFGNNIDLTPPSRNGMDTLSVTSTEDMTGYYGTNIHELKTTALTSRPVIMDGGYKEVSVTVSNADEQDALLIEIPYSGAGMPEADEITLVNPMGAEIQAVQDDGNGGGNMIVQNREDGNYIYFTVTDSDKIKDGDWKVRYIAEDVEISNFKMNGVDTIPELDKDGITITLDTDNQSVTLGRKINGGRADAIGTVDVYLIEDKDILSKIKTSNNSGDVLGVNILHKENVPLSTGVTTDNATLPDSLPNGKYYAVTTLSTTEGISLAISNQSIDFVNYNLPKKVDGVAIAYGGNGEIFVKVRDPEDADYTHYLAEIVAGDGTVLENNIGQFEKGESFVFGKEAMLEPGKDYSVKIKTLREEYKQSDEEYKTHYYYGTDLVSSEPLVLPEENLPKLKNVKVNFDTSGEEINTSVRDVVIEYSFENDVFVEMEVNKSKVYAFGVDPDPSSPDFSYFKKDWKFVLDDLEDGDYVIDFTAYTDKKDHIKGSETGVENAQLGFTVDTSAPVLSLAQRSVDRKLGEDDITVIFGANTVTADQKGKYAIEGITEKSAKLTLDGDEINEETEGVSFAAGGSFRIERTLGANEMYKEHLLAATDKAGNVSYMTVYAVRSDGFSFERLALCLDGEEIAVNSDGVKMLELKNGQIAELSARVFSDNGQSFEIEGDRIDWSVLYEKNALELKNGMVSALIPGETAVKAKLATAGITTDTGSRSDGMSDYVIINIANNSKSDLVDKITEAKNTLANKPDASESKINALEDAINEAEAVLNNSQSADSDFTEAVTRLTQAIAKFKKTDSSDGDYGGGTGGGGSARQYNVYVSETENGTVKVSQNSVYIGNSVTITATPDDGYAVADMLINGKSVGRIAVYTINSVNEDIEVKVIFEKKTELPFVDVLKSDWFFENVKYAYENGLMKGISDTEFAPSGEVTRAMFVTVLHRLENEPQADVSAFTDIKTGEYYEQAVAWANANGIVKGISEELFAPDKPITREQIAAMMFRFAKYKNYDVSVSENTNILSYDDATSISEYAIPAVQYAVGSGLMMGKSEETFNPADNATRAEIAAILQRFIVENTSETNK